MHQNEVDFTQLTPVQVEGWVDEIQGNYNGQYSNKNYLHALKDQLKRQGVSIPKKQ
jgi:hypothetical protein